MPDVTAVNSYESSVTAYVVPLSPIVTCFIAQSVVTLPPIYIGLT